MRAARTALVAVVLTSLVSACSSGNAPTGRRTGAGSTVSGSPGTAGAGPSGGATLGVGDGPSPGSTDSEGPATTLPEGTFVVAGRLEHGRLVALRGDKILDA